MIKRISAMVLLLVLLTSCSTAPAQTTPPPSNTQSIAAPTPAPASSPTDAPISSQSVAPTEAPIPADVTASVEESAENVTIKGLYSWNQSAYTYHVIDGNVKYELLDQLASYKPVKDAKPEENPVDLLGFLVIYNDESKENYYVTETQLYSKERGVLDATAEQCKALHDYAVLSNKENTAYAQWLKYMNLNRITEVKFSGNVPQMSSDNPPVKTTESVSFTLKEAEYIKDLANKLRTLTVKPGRVSDSSTDITSSNSTRISLSFDSGVNYAISIYDNKILISASDMKDNLIYQLANNSDVDSILRAAGAIYSSRAYCDDIPVTDGKNDTSETDRANPMTGKPVIYLYPEKQTDVSVKLDFGGEMLYTYPTIKDNGWNVTAYPDGRLINKADQTEHYYLFWEGNSDTKWTFDEGFCIAGSDTEAFLRQKLSYMGLTPREYNDFITYWVPKLKDNKYNLITFSGEQYEQLAPLTVSPTPDSVLRVHMVYKPLTERQTIPEQVLTPFERKDFSVVEWGGSVAK